MDGTIIPEDFMVRVVDDLYSMRHNMLNITAKSLEYFRARANVDDVISSTDSFPAAAAYQYAQVSVFCNIEQNSSEISTKASMALSIMITDYESLDNFIKQLEIYIPLIAHATQ